MYVKTVSNHRIDKNRAGFSARFFRFFAVFALAHIGRYLR